MTTPNIDSTFEAFLPYSIQYATRATSIAPVIADVAQRRGSDLETHTLQPGTYIIQLAYDGPGACSLVSWAGSNWVVRARVDKGEAYRARTAVTTVAVPHGSTLKMKLWADAIDGYTGALTVTPMPNYKK